MGLRLLGLLALAVVVYAAGSIGAVQVSIRRKKRWDRLTKKFPYSVTNIAHRGGSLLGPENTMFTFKRGVGEGHCHMLELDVRESKDGRVVVSHDASLERACGEAYRGVLISDLIVGDDPSATLPQSSRVIPLEFKTATIKDYVAASDVPIDDSTRVCLLREVFDGLPGVPLHIDIKDASEAFVVKVLDMIVEFERETITFLGSSQPKNESYIRAYFKQRKPSVRERFRLFPSVRGFLWIHFLYYTGLLPLFPLDIDVFSIPIYTSTMRTQMREEFGCATAGIGIFLFSAPTLWKYLQSRGVAVVGWVINDEVDFEEGIKLPLNGLMTDDPRKLHEFLVSHKEDSKLLTLGL